MRAGVHDVAERLRRARIRLSGLPYGDLLLGFIKHLKSLGFSFDPANAAKRDIERVVAWIELKVREKGSRITPEELKNIKLPRDSSQR